MKPTTPPPSRPTNGTPPSAPAPDPPAGPSAPAPSPAADRTRPFGAHLRMRWWTPLVIIPVLLLALLVLQIALTAGAVLVEVAAFGRDPLDTSISPLMMLAGNLGLAVMGPLAVLLTAVIGRVPWRSLLAFPRSLSLRRGGVYIGGSFLLVGLTLALPALIAPEASGLSSFALTGTTVALVVVAVLTFPLQAAGEELVFRGAIMPAAASWFTALKPALVVGMVVSSLLFGAVHLSPDPWLLAYYVMFGLCMAAMAVISQGLEASIAFHLSNNLIMMVTAALFAGGGGVEVDRSLGTGGPFVLVFIAMDLAAVALVGLYERRPRP